MAGVRSPSDAARSPNSTTVRKKLTFDEISKLPGFVPRTQCKCGDKCTFLHAEQSEASSHERTRTPSPYTSTRTTPAQSANSSPASFSSAKAVMSWPEKLHDDELYDAFKRSQPLPTPKPFIEMNEQDDAIAALKAELGKLKLENAELKTKNDSLHVVNDFYKTELDNYKKVLDELVK